MNYNPYMMNDAFAPDPMGKSRGVAALLAIFLGFIGVQYFYLGKTLPGVIFLIGGICSCGAITGLLSFIQGILMLCMTNQEFSRKFVFTTDQFPLF